MCQTATLANSAILLFCTKAVEERLASRINDLLDVTVDANDGLPLHIRGKCKRRVERLERSAEDLKRFKILPRDSYRTLLSRGSLKRTKESSGVTGVSPDTERVRPHLKNSHEDS